jgi:hypothetical protein
VEEATPGFALVMAVIVLAVSSVVPSAKIAPLGNEELIAVPFQPFYGCWFAPVWAIKNRPEAVC